MRFIVERFAPPQVGKLVGCGIGQPRIRRLLTAIEQRGWQYKPRAPRPSLSGESEGGREHLGDDSVRFRE